MAEKKDNSPAFADLIGAVKPLPPAPALATPPLPPPAPIAPDPHKPRRTLHRVELEHNDELVFARASDVPRARIEELRHGPLTPARELDLHRMSAAQAAAALRQAVKLARADGLRCLVVVCGKGSHSGRAGAVLPGVVLETLVDDCAAEIQGFRSAPPQFGGHGAVIVRLRSRARNG